MFSVGYATREKRPALQVVGKEESSGRFGNIVLQSASLKWRILSSPKSPRKGNATRKDFPRTNLNRLPTKETDCPARPSSKNRWWKLKRTKKE